MKSPYFRLIVVSAVMIVVGLFLFQPIHAQQLNTGLNFVTNTGLSNQDIRITIARIIRIILGFLGVIAVGLIMYAGFLWMTSKGNEDKTAQAKLILKNGVIGLAIILASFAIASFILSRLLGATGGIGGENGGEINNGHGIGSLGDGIVRSVYPEPFQKDVPRNTSIIVTFREPMLANSICDSVTNTSPILCSNGARIRPGSVKIFKTKDGDKPTGNVTDVIVTSNDNLTFVFKPTAPNYLGSPTEVLDYTVDLTNNIKKANGDDAFRLSDFYWSFQVSNLLDLTPPKIKEIKEGGIFPPADDEADTISGTEEASKANGSITISGAPNFYRAASTNITKTSATKSFSVIAAQTSAPTLEGSNTCADGTIDISIIVKGSDLAARVAYSQAGLLDSDVDIIDNKIALTPCNLTLALHSAVAAGNSWRVTVTSEKQADTLTVGQKIYSFVDNNPQGDQILVGINNADTAQNIVSVINKINSLVTAELSGGMVPRVIVRAKIAGEAGNRIELSTSNSSAFAIVAMRGGTDQNTTYNINGKKDQPKNAVIQINFTDNDDGQGGINPLMVSGSSEAVADKLRVVNADDTAKPDGTTCDKDSDCRSFKCAVQSIDGPIGSGHGTCKGNQLAGTWQISNQYRTVEFISEVQCGVNGCGEKIYCLPANSNLKVEAAAASLQSCTSSANCTFSPFTTCESGVCKDTTANKNYPFAPVLNGIVDLSDNSLDGNRNTNAQGQASTYNENLSIKDNAGRGDNYTWSFWTNDKLDLTPPQIISTSANNNQPGVNLVDSIEIIFSKLMLSSSMSTGTITANNGVKDITHKLINLWSLARNPIGYWISKQDYDVSPVDGEIDRSGAYLNHGRFNDSTQYQAQVGSGLKDIYQNCYKPSVVVTPSCNANAAQPSCCRNSDGDIVPTAELTADGNCP